MSSYYGNNNNSNTQPILVQASDSTGTRQVHAIITVVGDSEEINNCKLPHEAVRTIIFYYYQLLFLLFVHFALSIFILIRSSGYISAGLWVPILMMILFYIIARYPGLVFHNFYSDETQDPSDPVYRPDNKIRIKKLKRKYIVCILLILATIASVISESVKLHILKSFDSCTFDGSEGDVCSPTLNCYGDSDYYVYSLNCYVQNYGANNNNDYYQDCSCISSKDLTECYNFSNVMKCSDFINVLPTAEVFILVIDSLLLVTTIYFAYIIHKCMYKPADFIKNPVVVNREAIGLDRPGVVNVVNPNSTQQPREPVFVSDVSYA